MSMVGKRKVLHLVEWFDISGGLERVALEIACGLDREKYDVEIWCVNQGGGLVELARQKKIPVRIFNIATYHNPLNILRLARAFRQARPDIVHTHVYFASTIGRIAAKIAGVPVCINHVHSTYWHYTPQNLFIERVLGLMTHKIICVSNNVKDFVVNHEKIAASRVEVIYNGITSVNHPSRQEARQEFHVPEDEIIIITVASLFENKGHKVLLKALSLMGEAGRHCKCWIVGEGPMDNELKQLARQLNLDPRVVFWGASTDVPRLLAASDIFVLASIRREGLPISVLEAMSVQLPVIASRIGGVPELIDDHKNGRLVNPNDPGLLAQAIEELMINTDKRREYAREGTRKFKEQFEAPLMVMRIDNLYQECLKKNA